MNTSLNKIVDRIADVFSVFDFSFVISGVTAYMLIYIWSLYNNIDLLLNINISWFFIIFIIYILGLIMFAIGRSIRQDLFRHKKYKYQIFKKHGFTSESNEEIDALFSQYWDNLRNDSNGKSYDFYNRLWVMSAVYEGLVGDAILAFILLISSFCRVVSCYGCLCGSILILIILILMSLLIYILFREAKKNSETIITDLIVKYK